MSRAKWILPFTVVGILVACQQLVPFMVGTKQPMPAPIAETAKAQRYFWTILHTGRYADIDKADYQLMAAYLKYPNDPQLAAHIGFLHIWKIAERQRLKARDPRVVDEMVLAHRYFAEAASLAPKNPIYQGFLGDTMLMQGQIFHDKTLETQGYFQLKHAIGMWPAFNYFTAGYPMSTLPASDPHFKEGLEWQWATLDVCAGRHVDRHNPDFRPFMHFATTVGPQRACWNSWIAPHNFEGFFMNMGDMLVKAGDVKTAQRIYQNATLSSTYHTWPYRHLLAQKIKAAEANVKYFQQADAALPQHRIMFNSGAACMACHQRGRE